MNKEYDFNDNSDLDDKKDLFNAIATLTKLYTDKTHLIYELLQNAEDCHAKCVKFVMYPDRLELWHDGEPFSAVNLKSIRSVNQSTKSDKLNAIGKFGVGFKAVFCICENVEVYSEPSNYTDADDRHLPRFAINIENFRTMREKYKFDKRFPAPFTTCFVFPFAVTSDGKEFLGYSNIDDLHNALSSKLRTLGSDVMLFLKNITEISYEIEIMDGEEHKQGIYMLDRDNIGGDVLKITTLGGVDGKDEDATYIKYSAIVPETNGKTVDLVFAIKWDDNKPEFIKPDEKHRHVFVYFPTETESKLSFIVQAPFMTTPNRESVPSTEADNINIAIIAADLLEKAVLDISARGWLTLDFLNLLPIEESYPSDWLFKPISEKTNEMFKRLPIIPTISGGFTTATNANIARPKELTDIFSGDLLCKLLKNNESAVWVSTTLTEQGKFSKLWKYLSAASGTGVPVRLPEHLSALLSRKPQANSLVHEPSFFDKTLSDEWLVTFYNYIAGRGSDIKNQFKNVAFIKTESGNFVKPDNAILFIRPQTDIIYSDEFLFVADFIAEKCESLLHSYKIMPPDEYVMLKKDMEAYFDEDIDEKKSLRHLKAALRFLNKEGAREFFKEKLWLKCRDTNGDGIWATPENEIYLETDEYGISICDYFTKVAVKVYILDEDFYTSAGMSGSDLSRLTFINVKKNIYQYLDDTAWDWYDGTRQYQNIGFFRKYLSFNFIDEVVLWISQNNSSELAKRKSKIIFFLLKNVVKYLKGEWKLTKFNQEIKKDVAAIVKTLSNKKWIYNSDGRLVKTNEISRYDLDTEVYGDVDEASEIYDILGFNKTEADDFEEISLKINNLTQTQKEALLSKLTVSSQENEDFDFDDVENIQIFPVSGNIDLERLKNKINDDYIKAPDVKYDYVQRHVRISQDIKADKKYISGIYGGFCQMCEQHIGYGRMCALFLEPKKELKQLNLSFCPNCAAKYVKSRYDTDIMAVFADGLMKADINGSLKIPLGENEIRFTKAHLAEIQEILRLQGGEEN